MAESASSACGCSDVNERDRRVINAHRVFEGAFTRWRECWFLLREHERAIVSSFVQCRLLHTSLRGRAVAFARADYSSANARDGSAAYSVQSRES